MVERFSALDPGKAAELLESGMSPFPDLIGALHAKALTDQLERKRAERLGASPGRARRRCESRPTSPPIRIVVTNDSRQASRSWRILSSGPIRDIWSISSNGIAAAASSFFPSRTAPARTEPAGPGRPGELHLTGRLG